MIALLFAVSIQSFPQCGIRFEVPAGWIAQPEAIEADERGVEKCNLAVRPSDYEKQVAASRFDAADPDTPLRVTVYAVGFDAALESAGFEENGDQGLGVPGGYGSFAKAQEYRAGKWSGWRANTFYRGFAKDTAKLDPEKSWVYSGDITHIVVKDGKRIIGIECSGGVIEHPIPCDSFASTLLRSLQ